MVPLAGEKKTLVQCDFDGTITEEDASFMILDAFGKRNWRQLFRDYQEGRITVGQFNTKAFSTVKGDRESLLGIVREKVTVRPGFLELVEYCRQKGFRFVIVSNGLDFYIDEILRSLGMPDLEVFAAQTSFHPEGVQVQYMGPAGSYLDSDFKLAYVNLFLNEGYRLVYIGNGASDVVPARKSHYIFATGELLKHCKKANLDCVSFTKFDEIVKVLESWK